MTKPAMTFDELVERARALRPTAFEVDEVLTRVASSPPRSRRGLRQPRWRTAAAVLAIAVGVPATALAAVVDQPRAGRP